MTQCLDTLLGFEDLQEVSELTFWMDNCGSHFRTYQLMGHFAHFSSRYKVTVNFFEAYHGKGPCDQHFSQPTKVSQIRPSLLM